MLNLKSETLKFSVSGMRGLYGQDLNPLNIPTIVRAFEKILGKGEIAIAQDNRPTGPAISNLVQGTLLALGRNVHNLEIVPTPTIKHYIKSQKLAGGLMISASHNPIEYTAFKFIKKEGDFFGAQENQKLNQLIQQKNEFWGSYRLQGHLIANARLLAMKNHIDQIIEVIFQGKLPKFDPDFCVAIDSLGACAHDIVPLFLRRLKIPFKMLFTNPATDFPRPPEPTSKALKKLENFVAAEHCQIGFAFDPDADRLALVSDQGIALSEELTVPIAMENALHDLQQKKTALVVNLSSSYLTNQIGLNYKVETYSSKVGEANVVTLMRQKKSLLGGEGNGGVIDLRIDSCGRDSLVGMAHILKALARKKKKISSMVEELNPPLMIKQKIIFKPQSDLPDFESLTLKILTAITQNKLEAQVLREDGIKVIFNEGLPWLHIRPSNTEPIVRLIAEGRNMKEIRQMLVNLEMEKK